MNRLQWLTAAVFLFTATACSAQESPSSLSTPDGEPDASRLYAEKLREGKKLLEQKRFADAIKRFQQLLQTPLHETPNYEPNLYLAQAYCLSGDKKRGREVLSEFDCMLRIRNGETLCYKQEMPDLIPNEAISKACFETMCGEMYLDYYKNPTDDQKRIAAGLRREYAGVKAACE